MNQFHIIYSRKRALFFMLCMFVFSACSNTQEKSQKRVEIAHILELRPVKELVNDLYIGSDGDIEAIARILDATPSTIERIRKGETVPTEKFEDKIRKIATYYAQNDLNFVKLRSLLDPKWRFWDKVLYFPVLHPGWFWSINILLQIIIAFLSVRGIFVVLAEMLLFLIAWIVSLFPVANIVDGFVNVINPVLELLL